MTSAVVQHEHTHYYYSDCHHPSLVDRLTTLALQHSLHPLLFSQTTFDVIMSCSNHLHGRLFVKRTDRYAGGFDSFVSTTIRQLTTQHKIALFPKPCIRKLHLHQSNWKCGPIPIVMAALSNISGARYQIVLLVGPYDIAVVVSPMTLVYCGQTTR